MARYLFVSPHYDDAILSCGGTIASLCSRGAICTIITVFGGGPGPQYRLSKVARQYLSEDLARGEEEITLSSCWELLQRREEEDKRACLQIGNVERKVLAFPDAIYRGTQGRACYATESDLFGKADEQDEHEIRHMLFKACMNMHKEEDYWIFPALSQHIDHRIAHCVGWEMLERGMEVIFFEEFPYRFETDTFSLPGFSPYCISVHHQMQKKKDAVLEYHSQLPSLFGIASGEQIKAGNFLPGLEYYWIQNTNLMCRLNSALARREAASPDFLENSFIPPHRMLVQN